LFSNSVYTLIIANLVNEIVCKKMNILFYSPLNSRSKDTESLMQEMIRNKFDVFLLTQGEGDIYHEACEKLGVKCFSEIIEGRRNAFFFIRHAFRLKKFCQTHKIDVVFAHLEPAALSGVIAQFLVKSKIYVCRHHVDEVRLSGGGYAGFISTLIYKFARNIIVVSNRSKQYMLEKEKISAEKIIHINLGYNFDLWPSINRENSIKIRQKLRTKFILISASRLIKDKRVDLSVRLLKSLVDDGIDAGLLILGKGNEEVSLKALAVSLGLESRINFEGYVDNVLDYMCASDLFVHFSVVDSSAAIAKEAGLARLPVLACRGVGDFEDYITDGENGFLVDYENPLPEAILKTGDYFQNRDRYRNMGILLEKSVHDNFSIQNVFPKYLKILSSKN
jgi:glycosyltransferase involved in cell wall biosynthesis